MRDKLGRFTKGSIPWLKGKKGIHNSPESEFKKGIVPWNKGLNKSDPRVMKYVKANFNGDFKNCNECGTKYYVNKYRLNNTRFCSKNCLSKHLKKIFTNPNSFWKNNWNEYVYLHIWVEKQMGKPKYCKWCGDNSDHRYHWANKSGEYKRDIKDWIRLCAKCHAKQERGILQSRL